MRLNHILSVWLVPATFSSVVHAHISLDSPVSRYYQSSSGQADQSKLKTSPCGASNDERTTNASLITTFQPGETITVSWKETVQHPGYFRIAFDNDGQDFPFPGETLPSGVVVLADNITDKSGTGGLAYTQRVTLPNLECDNCTLQLIQVMTTDPPPYRAGIDPYFNCADLVLKASSGGSSSTGGISSVVISLGGTANTTSTAARGGSGGAANTGSATGGATGGRNSFGSGASSTRGGTDPQASSGGGSATSFGGSNSVGGFGTGGIAGTSTLATGGSWSSISGGASATEPRMTASTSGRSNSADTGSSGGSTAASIATGGTSAVTSTAAVGGSNGASTTDSVNQATNAHDDSSGCACRLANTRQPRLAPLLLGFGLALLLARRRQHGSFARMRVD